MNNANYQRDYQRENIRQIKFKLNRKTDPDLIEWIEKQYNIQGYLKELIKKDMTARK